MALYRQGEASMSAEGVITGDGTQWRQPLSLIRKGATIVFLTTPLKLAVINTIDSDTEMTAITTDGDAVPQSKYVILLNDSLTVDGMAQDVAETLRYYQSKETEIADAIEFFRDFDLQWLQDLVSRIEQAAQDTEQAKLAAEAAKTGAETARDNANQIKSDTQSIKDSAIQEVGQIKTDAEAAKTAAETARDTAQGYVTDAEAAKAGAETARDQAESFAQSVNPDNLLHKDQNLSDVIDKSLARDALDVPAKGETFLISNNFSEIADRAAAWLNMRPIGATPLGGDPVNDFDATTKRWVLNLVGGGGGPTMNGVQNYGVGEKTLWDSRAFIPQWAVPMDGQLLVREDWPELWAHAQMHSPISDANWMADKFKRVSYSTGDGSTTFRVPDLNGVHEDSLWALYGRGDSGGRYPTNTALENGVPNITGSFSGAVTVGGGWIAPPNGSATGAFGLGANGSLAKINNNAVTSATAPSNVSFDASKVNAAYGRASDVRPNSFVGVWIVRASGGFVAANTSWSVINGDEAEPGAGVYVSGGIVRSEYHVAGVRVNSFAMRALKHDSIVEGALTVSNIQAGKEAEWYFDENGGIRTNMGYVGFLSEGLGINSNGNNSRIYFMDTNRTRRAGFSYELSTSDFVLYRFNTSGTLGYAISFPNSGGTLALQGTSGIEFKHSIKDADLSEAVSRIDALRMVNFVYNDDEQERERFGIIAEEAELVAPQYIKHNNETIDIESGETRDRPSIDNNPIVMDLLGYVKHLSTEIEELKEEIKELKKGK